MEKSDQYSLLSKVGDLGEMSENEARELLDEVSRDGIASRAEAEAIIALNRQIGHASPDWDTQFCGLLKDYLVTAEEPVGWVDSRECSWLIGQIAPHQPGVQLNEVDLLLDLLPHAEGAPITLAKCALGGIQQLANRQTRMSGELVGRLRTLLLGRFGERTVWITRWEAHGLLKINDSVGFARNDEGWNHLYARAIANHLVAEAHPAPETSVDTLDRGAWLDEQSDADLGSPYLQGIKSTDEGHWFGGVSATNKGAAAAHEAAQQLATRTEDAPAQDGDWLIRRLGWGNSVSPADRALVSFLKEETPGFALGLTLVT